MYKLYSVIHNGPIKSVAIKRKNSSTKLATLPGQLIWKRSIIVNKIMWYKGVDYLPPNELPIWKTLRPTGVVGEFANKSEIVDPT